MHAQDLTLKGTTMDQAAILLTAASIVTVEARHSGAVGQLLGKPISPSGAYDKGVSKSKVLAAVQQTGFIRG